MKINTTNRFLYHSINAITYAVGHKHIRLWRRNLIPAGTAVGFGGMTALLKGMTSNICHLEF